MRNMKRLAALLLALLMLLGTSAGAHGRKDRASFAVPESPNESQNYEITFWAKNDTNPTQIAIYDEAVRDFEALYPNVKVTVKYYTDYNKIYNDVITNIATGTTPNVCISYPDHIATYITGDDVVVPLEELMSDKRYGLGGSELKFDGVTKSEIVQKYLKECALNETTYALPYMRSTEALYVNKTYVEKLGYTLPDIVTWDFVWEVSEAALAKEDDGKTYKVNGQNIMKPFVYKSTDNMMIQMLKQRGGDYSTASGEVKLFNETTTDILLEIGEHALTRAFSTFSIESYPADLLNAGQCIFAVDSTGGSTWMGPDAPLIDIDPSQLVDFEMAVLPIPQYDTENPKMISQGPSICIFNKEDSSEVLYSWLFAQYLLTDKVQIAYAKTEGYIPVTTKAQKSEAYLDYLSRAGEDNDEYYAVKLAASKLLLDNIENTFVTPAFNGSTSLRNAAGDMIEYSVLYCRRQKKLVTQEYIEGELRDKVTSLRRLDQIEKNGSKEELGALPAESKALLITLAVIWLGILGFFTAGLLKKREKR